MKFALLPPAYYGLVSPEILSTVKEIDSKTLYYGLRASLMLTCRLDEFGNDFGFPMREVDVDIDSWNMFRLLMASSHGARLNEVLSIGSALQAQFFTVTFSTSLFRIIFRHPETQVFASAASDSRELGFINIKISIVSIKGGVSFRSSRQKPTVALRFRGKNPNPDQVTVINRIASKYYFSIIGFSIHDISLMKFRCRACYKEHPYSGESQLLSVTCPPGFI